MRCVIFDMDGTLVDSSVSMTRSINYVRGQIGLPAMEVAEVTHHINAPDADLPMLFYQTPHYDPTHRALFIAHYMEHCNRDIRLYEGVEEVLRAMAATHRLAIATNASDFFAAKMLAHLGVESLFAHIAGANTYQSAKPDPLMLHKTMERLEVTASQTLLVGDSIKDQMAAQSGGIGFVHVGWGYGECEGARRIEQMTQLLEILTG